MKRNICCKQITLGPFSKFKLTDGGKRLHVHVHVQVYVQVHFYVQIRLESVLQPKRWGERTKERKRDEPGGFHDLSRYFTNCYLSKQSVKSRTPEGVLRFSPPPTFSTAPDHSAYHLVHSLNHSLCCSKTRIFTGIIFGQSFSHLYLFLYFQSCSTVLQPSSCLFFRAWAIIFRKPLKSFFFIYCKFRST